MRRALLLCLLLAGCADAPNRYPSLLPRPIEKTVLTEPAPKPVPALKPDAALDARIASIAGQSDAAAKAFADAAANAEAKVALARGMTQDSTQWLDAQVALSALDTARSTMVFQQVDLERLATDRGAAGLSPYPPLEQAVAQARARAAQAEARTATIEAALVH